MCLFVIGTGTLFETLARNRIILMNRLILICFVALAGCSQKQSLNPTSVKNDGFYHNNDGFYHNYDQIMAVPPAEMYLYTVGKTKFTGK